MADDDSATSSPASAYQTPLLPGPEFEMRSGIYTFANTANNAAMDLHGSDSKSIIGFPAHGNANQQWELEPLGLGFSIRNLHSGQYLTIEAGIFNGVPIVASGFPVSWMVEVDPKDEGVIQISWPGTHYAIDLPDEVPGTKIQLWQKYPRNPSRMWNVSRCGDAHATAEGSGRDVTITTTTTTVVKIS